MLCFERRRMEAMEAQQRQIQQHSECLRRIEKKLRITVLPEELRVEEREKNIPMQQHDEM